MAITIGVSAPEEIIKKLDEMCQKLGLNRSSAVSLAIAKLYQNQISLPEERVIITEKGKAALLDSLAPEK